MVLLKAEQSGLDRARQYVEEHFAETIGVKELCGVSGLYEIKLYKAWKWKFGNTIYQYQLQLRMDKAAQLLVTELPAKAVAAEVGYRRSTRFWHMFKKHFGLSPNEYKKQFSKELSVII